MNQKSTILFYINNQRIEVSDAKSLMTLADFLRYENDQPGTKIVCAEGDCGACTVMIGRPEVPSDKIKYKTINSCIIPLYSLNGFHIITVEGVGNPERLHPVQESMVKNHGAQCGYCTAGFICSLASAVENNLRKKNNLSEKDVKNQITGNLCRCTGYDSIIKAAMQVDLKNCPSLAEQYHKIDRNKELLEWNHSSCQILAGEIKIFIPNSMKEACEIKNQQNEIKIISGSTDVGVLINKGKIKTHKVLSLMNIPELFEIKELESGTYVGSQVTFAKLEKKYEKEFPEFAKLIHIFASPQIKNSATLVGNLMNASPIADAVPFLFLSDATVIISSTKGERQIKVSHLYKGYKELNFAADEIVKGLIIPKVNFQKLKLYKVSLRKDLDISAVTFAGGLNISNQLICDAVMVFGGVGPTVKRITEVEKFLNGKPWNKETFEQAGIELEKNITPLSDVRGTKEFRMQIAKNLLAKFFAEASG